jgi:hypothetical protein
MGTSIPSVIWWLSKKIITMSSKTLKIGCPEITRKFHPTTRSRQQTTPVKFASPDNQTLHLHLSAALTLKAGRIFPLPRLKFFQLRGSPEGHDFPQ